MKLKITKTISQISGSYLYFGFLVAFAMIMAFFMFKFVFGEFMQNTYATILALVVYMLLLEGFHYYSIYDKKFRISVIGSTIIIWIAYLMERIIVQFK